MLLVTHIVLATLGIALSFAAFMTTLFKPSLTKKILNASLFSTSGMLITGVALVATTHASLKHACTQGLLYLGVIALMYAANRKFLTLKLATSKD